MTGAEKVDLLNNAQILKQHGKLAALSKLAYTYERLLLQYVASACR
jgi:hypothetical protein